MAGTIHEMIGRCAKCGGIMRAERRAAGLPCRKCLAAEVGVPKPRPGKPKPGKPSGR